jgi:hypothetical protein
MSIPTTDNVGRSNLGVTSEQATMASDAPIANTVMRRARINILVACMAT